MAGTNTQPAFQAANQRLAPRSRLAPVGFRRGPMSVSRVAKQAGKNAGGAPWVKSFW